MTWDRFMAGLIGAPADPLEVERMALQHIRTARNRLDHRDIMRLGKGS